MVSSGRTYLRQRCSGRFYGRRVNCEYVPALPARIVQIFLDDRRKIPYLLVWRSPQNGTVREIVSIAREISRIDPSDWTGWIEIKRPDHGCTYIRTVERSLPRNGGKVRLIVCPRCRATRRSLYGWRPGGMYTTSAETAPLWECRKCLGLRYSSEGGSLVHHRRGAIAQVIEFLFSPLTSRRLKAWYPCVFASPQVAAKALFPQSLVTDFRDRLP